MHKLCFTAALVASLVLGLAAPAFAGWYDDWYRKPSEQQECVIAYGLWKCNQAQHAANWARDVEKWKFGSNGHNNMGDAFRHCAWMGALATRVGRTTAENIGFLHERHSPGPHKEWLMDTRNNSVGAYLGQIAVNARLADTWGYVLKNCETRARNRLLYGLNGVQGNY